MVDEGKINDINIRLENIVNYIDTQVSHLSDYEKVKFCFEYLIDNSTYDKEYPDQSLLSVMLENIGLCTSYAKSFKFLMDHFNIECFLVEGHFIGSEESHVWNMIKLDERWYHVDATQGDASNKFVDYSYLCVTEEQILKDHVILSPKNLPFAYSTSLNYLRKEGYYISSFNKDKIDIAITDYITKGNNIFILSFKDKKTLNAAKNYLIDQNGFSKLLLINGFYLSSLNYFENELTDTLIIINEDNPSKIDITYFENFSISSLEKRIREKYLKGDDEFFLLFKTERDYINARTYLFEERELFNIIEDVKAIDIKYYDEIYRIDFEI